MQLIRFAKNFINLIRFLEWARVMEWMCGVGWGVCLSYVNNYIISEELELFGTAIKADIHTKVGQSFGCTVSC